MDPQLQTYINNLEKDIEAKTREIQQHDKTAEEIIKAVSTPVPVQQTAQPAQAPNQPASSSDKIVQIAGKLGQLGVAQDVVQNLSQDAELSYLRQRVQILQKTQNQLQADYQKAIQDQKEQREQFLVLQQQKEHFEGLFNKYKSKISQYEKEVQLKDQNIEALRANLQELQAKQSKTLQNEKNQSIQQQTAQKRFQQYSEQIASLKSQLKESLDREKELRGQLRDIDGENKVKSDHLAREKDELINILKKQQALIDVLQREKLHLQGAIQLGFREEEFTQIIE